jgi:MFS family permease
LKNNQYKWYAVGMLWCISFFNYADRQAIFSLFPLLQKEMRLTPVQLGLLGSAFAWVYGLCAPFAGNIVDRVRRKTAILGGLYAWSSIAVVTSLSRTFRQLFSFMALEGLGETFYFPASMSMISDYHGMRTRSRAMGAHQTSVYVGTIGGGFFAGLIGQRYGWRWSFVLFGSLGILLGFVLERLLREPQRGAADRDEIQSPAQYDDELTPSPGASHHPLPHGGEGINSSCLTPRPLGGEGPGGRGLRHPFARDSVRKQANTPIENRIRIGEFLRIAWGTPSVLMLMGGFVCANFVALVLLSWMPKFLYDKFRLSLAMAGLSATIFAQLASMVGSPLGGWFADLLRKRMAGGRMLVQTLALFCGAPFVFLCGRTSSIAGVIAALTVWGLFKGLYDANIFASVFDVIPPRARGTGAGFMNMVGWLGGGGLAPVVIGFIAEKESLSLAISLASLVYVLGGILLAAAAFSARDTTAPVRE